MELKGFDAETQPSFWIMTSVTLALMVAGQCAHAEIPQDLEFHYQYRACNVTTDEPIYSLKASSKCTVQATAYYSDESCPPSSFKTCRTPANGIQYWTGMGGPGLKYYDNKRDGYSSVEGCKGEADDFINRANAGSIGSIPQLRNGYRYQWTNVQWEGRDLRAPITNHRLEASHWCTYTYTKEVASYWSNEHPDCGVETRQNCKARLIYNECRNPSHGIDSYKIVKKRDQSCGIRSELGFFDLSNESTVIQDVNGKLHGSNIDKKVPFLCETETRLENKYYCLKINEYALSLPEKTANIAELEKPIAEASADVLSKAMLEDDFRKSYDNILDLYQTDFSIKSNKPDGEMAFHQGIYRSAMRMKDSSYFKVAHQMSKKTLLDSSLSSAGSNYMFYPLWSFLTIQKLTQRRPQFKDLADLKILVLSSDIGSSQQLRGEKIIIAEYYSRLAFAYINKRSYDILQLEAVKAKTITELTELQKAIEEASEKVKNMNLPEAVQQSAIDHLNGADSSQNMISIIDDLIKTSKAEIAQTIVDSDQLLQELTTSDKLYGVGLSQIHLLKRNYNHAVLAMRTAKVAYHQVSDEDKKQSRSDTSFNYFTKNFKKQISDTLASSKKIYASLDSNAKVNIDMLDMPEEQLNLSYAMMDILDKFDMSVGSDLSETRIQILNYINSYIIEPLQSATEQVE